MIKHKLLFTGYANLGDSFSRHGAPNFQGLEKLYICLKYLGMRKLNWYLKPGSGRVRYFTTTLN